MVDSSESRLMNIKTSHTIVPVLHVEMLDINFLDSLQYPSNLVATMSPRSSAFLLAILGCTFLQTALANPHPERGSPGLVDLGYAKHIPTETKITTSGRKISIYKNIRFANPPTGDLRFRLPDTRLPKVNGIQDGNITELSNSCISSTPAGWPFPWNGTTWGQEDCLFLDVWVPEGVDPKDKVPVLHWFVGSAFAFGSKEMYSSPIGLFDVMDDESPFIYVANNYRWVNSELTLRG